MNLKAICLGNSKVIHEHDWTKGLLIILCVVMLIGWLDQLDNADYFQREAEAARSQASMVERSKDVPSVWLEGSNYRCRTAKIRSEWISVVMDQCAKLGQTLKVARASE